MKKRGPFVLCGRRRRDFTRPGLPLAPVVCRPSGLLALPSRLSHPVARRVCQGATAKCRYFPSNAQGVAPSRPSRAAKAQSCAATAPNAAPQGFGKRPLRRRMERRAIRGQKRTLNVMLSGALAARPLELQLDCTFVCSKGFGITHR